MPSWVGDGAACPPNAPLVAEGELVAMLEGLLSGTLRLYRWLGLISSSCVIDAQVTLPWVRLLLVQGRLEAAEQKTEKHKLTYCMRRSIMDVVRCQNSVVAGMKKMLGDGLIENGRRI